VVAQLVVMALFVVLGIFAVKRFHAEPVRGAVAWNGTSLTLTIGQLRTDFSHALEFTPTKKGGCPKFRFSFLVMCEKAEQSRRKHLSHRYKPTRVLPVLQQDS
jgi:hypothetical protein